MGTIAWIEATTDRLDGRGIQSMVDTDLAIQIAREEPLGIQKPEERVEAFVRDLPPLFQWFRNNYRDFPWRRTRDPWAIIVAEIMLQRTHAATVASVYGSFLDRYPGPEAICAAGFDEVFDVVEPLGFGKKKTNTLIALSETIVADHGGEIPNDLDVLLELPRIGNYTARACLCFGFGEPYAIVDANIETVMEDVFGYSSTRRAHKDDALYAFLDALIPNNPDAARLFNLALLDLRVEVCASDPARGACPLSASCMNAERPN